MSRNDEIVNDYRINEIIVKEQNDFKIEKNELCEEVIDDNPFRMYDEICDRMMQIKYELLKKSSLARMGGVVESTIERPIIGTQALDTCYGILFYDRKNKEGICGHAVPSKLTVVMAEMMDWLEGRTGDIEFMILPGFRNVDKRDYSGLEELHEYMKERKPNGVNMVLMENRRGGFRLHQGTLSYEFAFDTEKGDFVTEYVFFEQIEHNPRYIAPKKRA